MQRRDSLNPMSSPFHCLIKIRVVENNTRTLASQFQCYDFEITLCRRLQNLSSRDNAPSERNFFDEWMMADCVAYGVAYRYDDWLVARSTEWVNKVTVAVDNVDDARWDASFIDETSEFQRSKRRDFGRLNKDICFNSNCNNTSQVTLRIIVFPVANAGPTFHDSIPLRNVRLYLYKRSYARNAPEGSSKV
jgi:hypothetical protein